MYPGSTHHWTTKIIGHLRHQNRISSNLDRNRHVAAIYSDNAATMQLSSSSFHLISKACQQAASVRHHLTAILLATNSQHCLHYSSLVLFLQMEPPDSKERKKTTGTSSDCLCRLCRHRHPDRFSKTQRR